MKKLTKIKLINWHVFSNQTIIIDNNTLLSGENGSGKSTFLDAVQYLLVGGRGGVKFNIAATNEAKRTLEGYVRGRIGAVNKEFIRTGDVITHVALEFYDEIKKQYAIVGSVIDLPKNSSLKERLYVLENKNLTEDMYVSNNKPRDYKNMRDYLKTQNIELDYFETQKKYREAISKFFGVDAVKYSKLLPKALAFRPVNLQSLFFEFLLDDDPIDVGALKNNVNQLKRIEAQIKSDKEKLLQLDKIAESGRELGELKGQVDINELVKNLNWVEQREVFVTTSENQIQSFDRQLENFRKEKNDIDNKIEANDRRIISLEKAKDSNDISRTVDQIKQEYTQKEKEYQEQLELTNQLKTKLEEEASCVDELARHIKDKSLSAFTSYYYSHKNNFNFEELTNHLETVARTISSYDKAFYLEKSKMSESRREFSQQLAEAEAQLNSLQQNIKSYPSYVVTLISVINDELSKRYQKNINARPLADIIDVADETWRNSVEGYLNTQRFDIIIEPQYFDEALEIYDRVKNDLRIYGAGLVNTKELKDYDETTPNSLASKITTEHIHARRYVNMLLNSVVCVETLSELKHYKRSVTKTGMTYGNYTARQMNPRIWEIPFIGQKATDTQINFAKQNVEAITKAIEKLNSNVSANEHIVKLISQSHATQIISQNQMRYFGLVKDTKNELLDLQEKLDSFAGDKSFLKIQMELDKEKAQKQQLRLASDQLVAEMRSIREHRQATCDALAESKETLKQYLDAQNEMAAKFPAKLASAQNQYESLKQKFNLDFNKIQDHIAKNDVTINSAIPRLENSVTNLMREYVYKYSYDIEPSFDNFNFFVQEANVIRNQNLVRYEVQAVELRSATEVSFKEEFVNKLRASIQAAQAQIDDLNRALEGKTFGTDQYKLVHFPSEDPEYKMYYNLIMGSNDIDQQTLFTENLNKKNEKILMELFSKIASDDPQYDELSLKFLDYRNYMNYDIQIANHNGNISYFSKVSREKSGGETQVPFYIVIAASFQQLLSHNKRADSGCVVLFDEAFNNMDESRIEAMMKFYNSLSIQLFISIPPQRVPNIINYVNTSLIIVKANDQSTVQSFRSDYDSLSAY